nr:MAG TPA: hypothetical protein [Bacteriophage sp.]
MISLSKIIISDLPWFYNKSGLFCVQNCPTQRKE